MSNDRGRYLELKRGILCIDCHTKITDRLEKLRASYATARSRILQPLDLGKPSPTTADQQVPKEELPEART
ncbi:MAG: hypothetical protein OEW84_04670 [Aigarchaeota archaeon]|nr:hypothetical protein [Aigarchaeota archaeon]